ncbi:2-C-methyl-D-erythritol 4-phosphate cytidylyltransferase [Parapedobacter composti]|uniref:2-C-methyl-D-erythritol 4-phosphate cytidylyltransferase n=1 Tax=Parapedobacter composti TaxID=623281 RepID=A0A1I1KJD8_9SPHI|nr:2-C-methyl-D-erythritol 4-phosphate cytidylyltransferase [Parapedobacter composti]SFC60675.1 2-C-methyl-D-erythritol 4-phosphate cytidylyltransferase [Parapedobacter composti]
MPENYAIIVAGGAGSRMGTAVPKQFLPLNGTPVMMHAINAFYNSNSSPSIIAVLPATLRDQWAALCKEHGFTIPHTVADGGKTRFQSVKNGLAVVRQLASDLPQSLIAVHDAARPLVTPALIDKTYAAASRTAAAALATPCTNSVRLVSNNGLKNNAYRRELVYLMQTPQTFNGAVLYEAYEQPEEETYTDDASVVERKGYPLTLVKGDTRNIKITFPEDLRIAELLISQPKLRFE